jgi:hypothetical protein
VPGSTLPVVSICKDRWREAYRKVCAERGIRATLLENGHLPSGSNMAGGGADAAKNNFYGNIDVTPNMKLAKKKSIPLVSELVLQVNTGGTPETVIIPLSHCLLLCVIAQCHACFVCWLFCGGCFVSSFAC